MAEKSEKKKLGPGRHLSTIKRHRQSEKRNQLNKPALSEVRTSLKKLIKTIDSADKKAAQELFVKTQSLVDRAIKRGLLHQRMGHRHIARLHRRIASL